MSEQRIVIVRDHRAGVHVGTLVHFDPVARHATLRDARKIWYWVGAGSCHGLAAHGPDHEGSKVAPLVPRVELLDVVEVVDCTEEGARQCLTAPEWRP